MRFSSFFKRKRGKRSIDSSIEVHAPLDERRKYLLGLKKLGFSTAPLFVMAAPSEQEAREILLKTFRLRFYLIGESWDNEVGLFFTTNELPAGQKLFTFALRDAKDEDIYALAEQHIPSAVANYWYFTKDYKKHLAELQKWEKP